MTTTTLTVGGRPYEQGVRQGEGCALAIAVNWAQISDLIIRLIDGRETWYRGLVEKQRRYIERIDPDTVEELRGIADGSGIPLEHIEAMNFPMYTAIRRANIIEECSTYAVGGAATADGKTYLLKTRDQPVDQFQFEHVMLERRYADGSSIVEVNAAGIITNPGSGMNEAGLAVGTAGSWSRQRMRIHLSSLGQAYVMPDMHYVLRNATTVHEAHQVLGSTPRLAGMNIVLADATGEVATVEVTSDAALLTVPEDAIAVLTNHYVHPDLRELNDPPEANPSSHQRLTTITNYLRDRRRRISALDMLRLSMDHEHGPQNSVCRHSPDGTGSTTRYVSLMVAEDFDVWTHDDFPCRMAAVSDRNDPSDQWSRETAGVAQ